MKSLLVKIKNVSLKTELFVNLMLLVVIAVLTLGSLSYFITRDALKDQVITDLSLASINKESHVYEFLGHKRSIAASFSTDGHIITEFRKAKEGNVQAGADLGRYMAENKAALDLSIFGVNILDTEGVVVVSTDERELGETEPLFFEYREEIESLEFSEGYVSDIKLVRNFGENNFSFAIFSPVIDPTTEEKLGYVLVYTDIEDLNNVMTGVRRLQLGATAPREDPGETLVMYLVNSDGLMIAKSDHVDATLLSQTVHTEPVRNCDDDNPINDTYLNYNNIPVVGASACLVNGWTLVVEINEGEAFAGIAEIQRSVIAVMAILLLVAAIIAFLLTKKNVDPIHNLLSVVKKFGKGDFSKRAEVKNKNEVGQLTREFNNMADKLEELDSAKSEFISLASHQLKNPLSVIKMNSELLSMDKDLKGEQKEYVKDIEKSVDSLDRLIKTLLNVSKIEVDVFDLKLGSINLAKIIEEEIEELRPSIDAKKIKLSKDIKNKSLIAESDESIARIALENVISNAVKYTPENKEVLVSASRENDNILIKVSDTGYGIPEKEQGRIFTKMYRASNVREAEPRGSGLGLYMTKKQLEKAGGKIWFESREGGGTTFYISFPVK